MTRLELVKLYVRAAVLREAFWQSELAALYATGEPPLKKSHERALRWYLHAAKRGDASAQFNVAFMYLLGEGTTQDSSRARYWLRLSAAQGYEQSLRLLSEAFPSPDI